MRVYLSGAIEYAPDHGRAWREAITPFLESLGHDVYDPSRDERKNLDPEEFANFRAWKHSDLPRFQQTVRKIIDYDLDRIARHTDAVVCFWDVHAQRGAGTQAEVTFAYWLKIPVYLITSTMVTDVSGWILGCCSGIAAGVEQFKNVFPDYIATSTGQ
jgi:hypothetical protein